MKSRPNKGVIKVKVLAVQRIRDVSDGEVAYQVTFGKILDINEEIRDRISKSGQSVNVPPGAMEMGVNTLILVSKFDSPLPYRLDSTWNLIVDSDGSISLSEDK